MATGTVAAALPGYVLHLEVWVLVGAIVGLGLFVTRVIGPKVVPAGEDIVTAAQRRSFIAAVLLFAAASTWPVHDVADDYLYSVHMVQHLLITFVVPPLFLLATPRWLADLVISDGGPASRALRRLAHPVVAGVAFNAITALLHWGAIVNLSAENGPFHYAMHVLIFTSALLMWVPVVGPLEELRLSPPGQMLYLFLMSIIPTVPAGWLTFADGVVYDAYDVGDPLWNVSPVADQQAAGAIMKVLGGFYLWGIIAVKFFGWARREEASNREPVRVVRSGDLTYDEVTATFERLGEPPHEQVTSSQ